MITETPGSSIALNPSGAMSKKAEFCGILEPMHPVPDIVGDGMFSAG